jgi:tRNA pseudouridine55 synthase
LDADGKVTRRQELVEGWLDPNRLEAALESELERTLQIPPLVSAIKVDGQRSYVKARKGELHDLDPRDVRVHELTLLQRSQDRVRLRLCVSKGYYVRSLARDLGDHLGVPSHLSELRRLTSGPLRVEDAITLPLTGDEPLLDLASAARLALPSLSVTTEGAERLRQGKTISSDHILADGPESTPLGPILAAFQGDILVALVKPSGESEFRVQRGMNDPKVGASPLPGMDPGD